MHPSINDAAHRAAAIIQQIRPNFTPRVGIVLGSGLGSFANEIDDAVCIDYQQLPGFPLSKVMGHGNKLVLGYIAGVAVACLQGRSHCYEGHSFEVVTTYVRTLRVLGCSHFVATNASGSLNRDMPPGSLMMLHDHINLQPGNPLVGSNDADYGPRFLPLNNLYDPQVQHLLEQAALESTITLYKGVYLAVLGPNYETAAEIRAFKMWGADAVGMSTVPEVLVAHHCGMKVGVVAIITNYATGLDDKMHDHSEVVKTAEQATSNLQILLKSYIKKLL